MQDADMEEQRDTIKSRRRKLKIGDDAIYGESDNSEPDAVEDDKVDLNSQEKQASNDPGEEANDSKAKMTKYIEDQKQKEGGDISGTFGDGIN